MPTVLLELDQTFHFFLHPEQRSMPLECHLAELPSVKHLIESLGIPHTEIGLVYINEIITPLSYLLRDGDQINVLPAKQVDGLVWFILDNHLGRLAAYLRMLGFDCRYRNDYQDEELAQTTYDEDRILLTRDRRLLMRKMVRRGMCIRSDFVAEQTLEVLSRYRLWEQMVPFRRCLRCNSSLAPVSKEEINDQLQPLTRLYYNEFFRCPACRQIYWKGSHYDHMQTLIKRFRAACDEPSKPQFSSGD